MKSDGALSAGEWVEVRSREEILRTLDANGRLENLPFMPEMIRYAGQRFQVFKRAHRTCDTIDYVGGRHLKRAVHLEGLRCDGSAHGNCEARCLLFWKDAWLKKVDGPGGADVTPVRATAPETEGPVDAILLRGTREPDEPADTPDPTYVCQATKLLEATVPLRRSDLEPYLEDLASGNVGPLQLLRALAFEAFSFLVGGRYGLSTPLNALYKILHGTPYPEEGRGKIPKGGKTPSRRLDLQPGEMVRVRTLPEILETIDEAARNRGMVWHAEMVAFTGRTFRVAARLTKFINEKTGKMIRPKNDVIILENAVCHSRYVDNCRLFCPRRMYLYFREIWLERVPEALSPRGGSGGR